MYSSSKGILALMVLGFTAMLIAEIIIIALSTRAEIGAFFLTFTACAVNANPHIEIPMWKCIQTDTWPLSYLYWLPFLAFETLLFALAIVKGAQSLRDHELKITLCGPHALRALEVLIRDSILYFMLYAYLIPSPPYCNRLTGRVCSIFAIYLVNVLAWTIEDGRIGEIPVSLAVAVSTVMAQRLLLNIRANFEQRRAGAAMGMDGASTGADSFQLSTMAFDGRFAETGISTSTAVGSVTGDESKIGREKEPGHAFENEMAKEKDAGTGGVRLRTIWTEGLGARGTSIMSGSTVISPTRKYAGYSGHERYQTDSIFQFESEAGPSSPLSYSYASPVTSLAPGHVPPN
ncbi:hypothetical protein EW145_g4725 [Phellinidium pouzarii]|uniref:Uncharacterized protein n=1 Tax=Phellinidium pouzarii TaxID=167371 RepID=A0A4S4L3V7_9AGAM|nr:hypothetical protein EW145_g4725 [Phellinidium pouzarii]